MKIVADERIAALRETFGGHGEVATVGGREIRREHLMDADVLLTRTVTPVGRRLLEGTPVRFVGTTTIGTDHLDTTWLDAAGIRWAAAPGCNADATAQYSLAIYLLACRRLEMNPFAPRFGIVGCGNVGGRLKNLLEKLGVPVIACDPPLESQGGEGFHSMEQILQCQVVSLHVPLTRSGRWPTYQMFDETMFDRMPAGTLLLNACRGDVVEGAALRSWISRGGRAALDVWPGEPDIDPELIQAAIVATPHIAGYSLEGKLRATSMVYLAFCEHFGLSGCKAITPPPGPTLDVSALPRATLEGIVLHACPVERDDRAMRERLKCPPDARVRAYDELRSHYAERRDFGAWTLNGAIEPTLARTLTRLGFTTINH